MCFYAGGAAGDVAEAFGAVDGAEVADDVFGGGGEGGLGWGGWGEGNGFCDDSKGGGLERCCCVWGRGFGREAGGEGTVYRFL